MKKLSSVRVTYSGLIAFITSIVSVVTGTIFVVMVTRNLNAEDFGFWTLIGSTVSYVLIIRPMITYWSTRQLSRGEQVAKTTIITSSLFSIVSTIGFLGFAIYYVFTLNVNFEVLLLASALVPFAFLHDALSSVCMSKKPQAISYGLVAFETTKIPFGILFVVTLDMGINGAIVTILFADAVKNLILFLMVRKYVLGKFQFAYIKFWLRMSWLTLYQTLSTFVRTMDVFIFSVITGSLTGLAYWGVSQAIANITSHSQKVSQGLYPKLIATQKKEFAEQNMTRTLFFAIPILGASIVFVKPALHILNPIYTDGIFVAILLSFRAFIFMITNMGYQILRAFDDTDINNQTNFRNYLKSMHFFIPTLNYIFYGSYAVLLITVLLLIPNEENDLYLVTIWSTIYFLINLPLTAIILILLKRKHDIQFRIKPIIKSIVITLFSSVITLYLLEEFLIYSESIYEFLPAIIPFIILGGSMYFGIMYIIDQNTKKLFKAIYLEIRNRKNDTL